MTALTQALSDEVQQSVLSLSRSIALSLFSNTRPEVGDWVRTADGHDWTVVKMRRDTMPGLEQLLQIEEELPAYLIKLMHTRRDVLRWVYLSDITLGVGQ